MAFINGFYVACRAAHADPLRVRRKELHAACRHLSTVNPSVRPGRPFVSFLPSAAVSVTNGFQPSDR